MRMAPHRHLLSLWGTSAGSSPGQAPKRGQSVFPLILSLSILSLPKGEGKPQARPFDRLRMRACGLAPFITSGANP